MSDDTPPSTEQQLNQLCQPYDREGRWELRLRVAGVGGAGPLQYGHSYVQLQAPDGRTALEVHGFNRDPLTGHAKGGGGDKGDQLGVAIVPGRWDYFEKKPDGGSLPLAAGTYEEIKPHLRVLFAASQAIDAQQMPYTGWGFWQPGQNCNSVAHTVVRAMGHDMDPQAISRFILTGSSRLLPASGLEGGTAAPERVEVARLDQTLSELAAQTGRSVVMPDLDRLIDHALQPGCPRPEVQSGTSYEADGTIRPIRQVIFKQP